MNKYQIILIAAAAIIFATNYQPGKYLLGWDNFNSELNPLLAVNQALSAGWSNFRSFGLVAGLGYATDLIHAISVWLMSFVLPPTTIRYLFHTLLLAIGGFGAYALFTRLQIIKAFAFLGALYYMLNFGTVQIFGLPYEPFSMFFGFLPWALVSWFDAMEEINKKTLLRFTLANILLSGAFYVQTMFIVYAMILVLLSVFYIKRSFKKIAFLWGIVFLVNAYWILTQLYFLTDAVSYVREAKQTLLGWRIPFFQNKAHSSLMDFFTQRGYYSDFEGKQGLIFTPWISYLSQPLVRIGQLLVMGLIFIGILDGTNRFKRHFLLILLITAVALLMDTPVLREIHAFIRQSGFIDQIFRSPFSKLVSVQSLILGYFLALGANAIYERLLKKRLIRYAGIALITATIALTSFPVFQGQFFSPEVQVTLPNQYMELFDFFRSQNRQARIATLPEMNVWGWYVYKWGYIGSGFLWHAIEQPIISRSYDVWSRSSENYYWELTNAMSRENADDLIRLFQKYNITYLIVDYSITINPEAVFKLQKIVQLLEADQRIRTVAQLNGIDVYALADYDSTTFSLSGRLPNIGPRVHGLNNDLAYTDNGIYTTNEAIPFDLYYPFLGLETTTFDANRAWTIIEHPDSFEITTGIPPDTTNVESVASETFVLESGGNVETTEMNISIQKTGNILSVVFPKIAIQQTNVTKPNDCSTQENKNPSQMMTEVMADGKLHLWTSEGTKACWGYHYDNAQARYAYLLRITSQNSSGVPVNMHGVEHTHQQIVLEQQLNDNGDQYFILPSGPADGRGFSINFQNFSFRRTKSENIVSQPLVYLFPQRSLQHIVLGARDDSARSPVHPLPPESVQQLGSWGYILTPTTSDSTLLFMQAFDPGWTAWEKISTFPYLRRLTDHVLVNNWANGWKLEKHRELSSLDASIDEATKLRSSEASILVFFWPQILQWIGFGLLPLPFIWVLLKRNN